MKKTFVTYLGSSDFLPGVLALNESLKKFNKSIPLLILVNENLPSDIIDTLNRRMLPTKIVKDIRNPLKLENDKRGYKYMYTKLRLFELTDYDKIIYIDADIIVFDNIEPLFNRPHMSAVAAGSLVSPEWTGLNSGFTIIEPKKELFERMYSSIDHLYSNGGDQGFLNSFYKNWPEQEELHLEHKYNVPLAYLDQYCNSFGYLFSYVKRRLQTNITCLHYWGAIKPWQFDVKTFSPKDPSRTAQAIILWWDFFKTALDG